MPQLKYKDPADGLWKPVPVGGAAAAPPAAGAGLTGGVTSYEVGAGAGVVVAADTVALDTAFTDTLYSPVAHAHTLDSLTDADTVTSAPAVGDSLVWNGTAWVPSGPAILTPPAPTALSHAAPYVDGIPRCADVAARTALFPAPVTGDRCFMEDTVQFVFYNHVNEWTAIGGHLPYGQIRVPAASLPGGLSRINLPYMVGQSNLVGGVTWDAVNNCLELPVQGHYSITASMDCTGVPVAEYAQVYVGNLTIVDGGAGSIGRPADAGYVTSVFAKSLACPAGTKVSLWANTGTGAAMSRADLQVVLTTV